MSFEEKLGTLILHEIEIDDEPQPYELGCIIIDAHEKAPDLLDALLIALCGWRYESLASALADNQHTQP